MQHAENAAKKSLATVSKPGKKAPAKKAPAKKPAAAKKTAAERKADREALAPTQILPNIAEIVAKLDKSSRTE